MAIRDRRYQAMPRVDWWMVLDQLAKAGYPLKKVCHLLEIAPSTVSGWKNEGKEPRHYDGERLIVLWKVSTNSDRDKLPITHRPPWL